MKSTHFDGKGSAKMVDVSKKKVTTRIAKAEGWIYMKKSTLDMIKEGSHKKGDVLAIARIAGIMASKYNKKPPTADDSSDEEDVKPMKRPSHDRTRVLLPTDLLSTPAFPSMIQNMLSPRPAFTPQQSKIPKPKTLEAIPEVKEIATSIPKPKIKTPLTEKSENVLVL